LELNLGTDIFLKLILIGTIGGFLSGLFGIGGGIVIVPMLIFLLKTSQTLAQGISIGALLLPVGILAAVKYHKNGNLNISYSFIIAAGMFIGAYFGATLANSVGMETLKKMFGVLLFCVSLKILFF
jgi:uncharacterized protein